jgi:hypothetical protein
VDPRPAKLTVDLYFPPSEMNALGPITLNASSSEHEFGAMTYYEDGPQKFEVEISPEALCTNVLPITFSLDKYLPPSRAEARELGMVVTSISLRSE